MVRKGKLYRKKLDAIADQIHSRNDLQVFYLSTMKDILRRFYIDASSGLVGDENGDINLKMIDDYIEGWVATHFKKCDKDET